MNYNRLKQLAKTLPEVEESTSYGTPALKVRGKLMVRLKEDDTTVVLRTTWEDRERLMAVHPEAFFITEHYRNAPWVLLRLSAATPALLRPALAQAWALCAPKSLLRNRASRNSGTMTQHNS